VDDAAFLSSGRRAYGGGTSSSSSMEDRHMQLLEERRKIEERSVQSSFRSISLLKESEDIGCATAEELVRQREQLQNAEGKLDEINSTLRVSQRHIQGIKSVFGSIRNYFSGGSRDVTKVPASQSSSSLDKEQGATTDSSAESKNKLARILETSGNESSSSSSMVHPVERLRANDFNPPSSRDVNDILDQNLEDIGVSLSRLKGLGLDLNKEIVDQNDMLERIRDKTEDADFKIQRQNKDMNRILKK